MRRAILMLSVVMTLRGLASLAAQLRPLPPVALVGRAGGFLVHH